MMDMPFSREFSVQRLHAGSILHGGRGKAMSKKGNEFHEREDFGGRWAALLRARYDVPHAAKRIARDFDCAPRTAKSWLEGNPPELKQILRAASVIGVAEVAALLFPDSDLADSAALRQEFAALKSQLEVMEDRIGRLYGDNDQPTKGGGA